MTAQIVSWPKHPAVYEINAWVWLDELTRRHGRRVGLADIPETEWDALADFGVDAVWLMGVWERSPRGKEIALANAALREEFGLVLPGWKAEDVAGSPYCVRNYAVDARLGGDAGLAAARDQLRRRGMRLLLDFVPNHVAPDHPWVTERPDYCIAGSADDLRANPESYLEANGRIVACGRDPYFPAWPDVVQLNAFDSGLRKAAAATLLDIAGRCDGVRCDMAMLFLNAVFAKTWGAKAGPIPESEYWRETIGSVKATHPEFLFIAEAYWDLEWELQRQGFDYCYDKRLYDRLAQDTAESVGLHLAADLSYQEKLLRFIENHDEPRARSAFGSYRQAAAAVTMSTIPGAKLYHEGQFEGRRIKLPVFLGRRPDEPVEGGLRDFYRILLGAVKSERLCEGEWRLCQCSGWPDNQTFVNIVAWCWSTDDRRHLIVVNLSNSPAQARVRLPWDDLGGAAWAMTDLLDGAVFERCGDELADAGLYVDLAPWHCHMLGRFARRT